MRAVRDLLSGRRVLGRTRLLLLLLLLLWWWGLLLRQELPQLVLRLLLLLLLGLQLVLQLVLRQRGQLMLEQLQQVRRQPALWQRLQACTCNIKGTSQHHQRWSWTASLPGVTAAPALYIARTRA